MQKCSNINEWERDEKGASNPLCLSYRIQIKWTDSGRLWEVAAETEAGREINDE